MSGQAPHFSRSLNGYFGLAYNDDGRVLNSFGNILRASIYCMSRFTLHQIDGDARLGTLHTSHGDVPTPAFMPVATQGSVKAVDPNDLRRMGAAILLGNTYHLYLRPGVESVRDSGGLAAFMAWNGPVCGRGTGY